MDRNLRKVKQGVVSSDKMDKTITVVVENRKRHPMYNKIMTTTKKLKAHDENNEAGDEAPHAEQRRQREQKQPQELERVSEFIRGL